MFLEIIVNRRQKNNVSIISRNFDIQYQTTEDLMLFPLNSFVKLNVCFQTNVKPQNLPYKNPETD